MKKDAWGQPRILLLRSAAPFIASCPADKTVVAYRTNLQYPFFYRFDAGLPIGASLNGRAAVP